METTKKTAEEEEANASVCSLCRITFRVGKPTHAVVCPGCNYLLSFNASVAPLKKLGRDKKQLLEQREASWDLMEEELKEDEQSGNGFLLVVLSTCLVAFLSFAYWMVLGQAKPLSPYSNNVTEVPAQPEQHSADTLLEKSAEAIAALVETRSTDEIWQLVDQDTFSKETFDEHFVKNKQSFDGYKVIGDPEMLKVAGGELLETELQQEGSLLTVYTYMKEAKVCIDWPSLVGYNQTLITGIQDQAEESVELRCIVQYDEYYDFVYKDTEWVCVKITLADQQQILPFYGYLKRTDSAGMSALKKAFEESRRRVILNLSNLPNNPEKNKFIINQVVSSNWFLNNRIKKDE